MDQGETDNQKKPRQNALKYGGEGAVRRISTGQPFIGLAAEEQKAVINDLEEKGVSSIVRADAIRLQTSLNLYWSAVKKAAADGDIQDFDRYIARYGWLAGVTLRAFAQVSQNEQKEARARTGIIDVLKAMEGGENG